MVQKQVEQPDFQRWQAVAVFRYGNGSRCKVCFDFFLQAFFFFLFSLQKQSQTRCQQSGGQRYEGGIPHRRPKSHNRADSAVRPCFHP